MKTRIAVAFLLLAIVSLCFSQQVSEPKAKVGHLYTFFVGNPFEPHTYYALVIDTKLNDENKWFVKYIWTDAENRDKYRYIGSRSESEAVFLTVYTHQGKATVLDSIAFKLIK